MARPTNMTYVARLMNELYEQLVAHGFHSATATELTKAFFHGGYSE